MRFGYYFLILKLWIVDIKRATLCTDLEAAITAEKLRNSAVDNRNDFTFETVLSTERNLDLLKRAKQEGYFLRCIYVLTADVKINIERVNTRVSLGGHNVINLTQLWNG